MKTLHTRYLKKNITYTGQELRAHWIMDATGCIGDAIVAFQGTAQVPIDHMVDLVDVRENAPIFSQLMLHFLVEHFGIPLGEGVVRQRLLIALIAEELRSYPRTAGLVRRGDDLYDGKKKLSVSIATASPVSCCMHIGLNIIAKGAPVAAIGLADYGIDPVRFAARIMRRYADESVQMEEATCKVRSVP
jgi:uncharacterized protein